MLLRLQNDTIVNTQHIVMVTKMECLEAGNEDTNLYINTTRGQIKINCGDEDADEIMRLIETAQERE